MRGKRTSISIQFESKRRKKSMTVEALSYGPLAVHPKLAEDGTLTDRYVVTHIATGLKLPGHFANPAKARELVNALLDSGINWNFTNRDRMSKPDRIKAAEIAGRMKR